MAKIEKDDRFCCAACGMEVVVNKACDCIDPDLLCCGGPMKHIKSSPGRSSKLAAGAKTTAKRKA
jgi:hypothetical protein